MAEDKALCYFEGLPDLVATADAAVARLLVQCSKPAKEGERHDKMRCPTVWGRCLDHVEHRINAHELKDNAENLGDLDTMIDLMEGVRDEMRGTDADADAQAPAGHDLIR